MPYANTLIPHMTINDNAKAAIEFYKKAFGAEEVVRHDAEDGKRLMHAHLRLNDHDVFLMDAFPEYGSPITAPSGVMMALRVDDPDQWWERATKAGATVVMPLDDQFWGDRWGLLKDPFGHEWSISAPSKKK
ncbi:glyoxalase/bleomycin resistance/extradiol dioxygenase family protein [Nordella sp. HKS 07]|uniref:VOC family protein n=1 Tax=Nordella sp. HKS 07 TaxID=2712222 RepID=UPI001FEFC032|nr:glyoxalase/bleomycin resistance/extradiol dioxygenase family protein [Nordella sp. HKS 07]